MSEQDEIDGFSLERHLHKEGKVADLANVTQHQTGVFDVQNALNTNLKTFEGLANQHVAEKFAELATFVKANKEAIQQASALPTKQLDFLASLDFDTLRKQLLQKANGAGRKPELELSDYQKEECYPEHADLSAKCPMLEIIKPLDHVIDTTRGFAARPINPMDMEQIQLLGQLVEKLVPARQFVDAIKAFDSVAEKRVALTEYRQGHDVTVQPVGALSLTARETLKKELAAAEAAIHEQLDENGYPGGKPALGFRDPSKGQLGF